MSQTIQTKFISFVSYNFNTYLIQKHSSKKCQNCKNDHLWGYNRILKYVLIEENQENESCNESLFFTHFIYFGISVVPVLIRVWEVISPSVGSATRIASWDCSWSAVSGFKVGVPWSWI